MTTEWYKVHRPKRFEEMIGQGTATKQLLQFVAKKSVPHALLFSGPSGAGKTTAARILSGHVKCHDLCYREINASSDRGIDMVREIQSGMNLAPMQGKSKMFVLDEAHAMLKPPQEALLKTLEDTPKHVYFILCTSDPSKLIPAMKTRLTEVKFGKVADGDLWDLCQLVLAKEALREKDPKLRAKKAELKFPEDVYERLVKAADGSARKALVLLEQIEQVETEEEALEILEATDKKSQGWELAKLLHNSHNKWVDAAKLIKTLDEDAEGVRRVVLAWAEKVLLGGGPQAKIAARILNKFQFPLYDTGRPGLSLAAYEFYHQ